MTPPPGKKELKAGKNSDPVMIAGIGASAGGLFALKTFCSHVPEESGLAYVVVIHLSPSHHSHLAELLQPHLKIPVQQVTDAIQIQRNHVYVIPPGANLNSIDTHLRLSKLENARRAGAPIDHFFRTLAKTHKENAIGVILTGTGSDGALGIKEIKREGGLVIVQDPDEAEYDGMPQSAISAGLVDKTLPLAEIPGQLVRFASIRPKLPVDEGIVDEETSLNESRLLQKIFAQVRARTGRDFSRYKLSTIMRRLYRRMQLNHIEELDEYLTLLREDPDECRALSDDFLITVTNFFRDPAAFDYLKKKIIPELLEGKGSGDTIRVWSVGCATGEEAYSIAMALLEVADKHGLPPKIQVFASDLHEHSLRTAREGHYTGDIEVDVNAERLQRFFIKESGGYRIRKELRECVVFSPHNLLSDPPFSKIGLIMCRNLQIYLQREAQRDVIGLFHYALLPDGFLMMGLSETMENSDFFTSENRKFSLYRKRNVSSPEPRLLVFPLTNRGSIPIREAKEAESRPVPYGELHQRIVERYGPPSLLLSPDHQVVHFSENVERFLVHPGGKPTFNVYKLVREELRMELRALVQETKEKGQPKRSKPIPVLIDGRQKYVIVSVRSARGSVQDGFALVVFDEYEESAITGDDKSRSKKKDVAVKELETELELTKQRLQSVIKEYETSQEEMKASNEELQSANEELRSTMEELETSREALQSMNEELTTLNQENRHKVEELSQLSGDLQNLLAATDIATLFLDRELRILRFTPRVGEFFNVRVTDRGRPLSDLTHRLGYDQLMEDAKRTLEKLIPAEREVQDEEGRRYLARVLPYRSVQDRIEGVVITLVDITSLRRSEKALKESEEQFRSLLEASSQLIWKTNASGQIEEDPLSWRGYTGQTYNDCKGFGWMRAVHPDDQDQLKSYWKESVKSEKDVFEITVRLRHFSGAWRWSTIRMVPLRIADGSLSGWIGMTIDIHDEKEAVEALTQSEERYRTLFNSIDEGFCILEVIYNKAKKPVDYRFLEVNPAFERQTRIKEARGKLMREIEPDHEQHWFDLYGRVAETGKSIRTIQEAKALIGGWFDVYAFKMGGKESRRVAVIFNDITSAIKTEEALRKSEERLRLIIESAKDYAIFTMDTAGIVTEWNEGAEKLTGYPRAEMIGKKASIIFPKKEGGAAASVELKTAREKGRAENERWHVRKDGSRFWGSGSTSPLMTSDRQVRGFLKIMQDKTERQNMETSLREAKENAEKAARAKEEFLAHMSHEIRTPLNAVSGLAALLLQQDPKPGQQENLQALQFSAENLRALINDILDFSKISAGKVAVEETDIHFRDLIINLQKAHGLGAKHKGIELQVKIDKKIPEIIITDQLKLSQTLHNLLSNAIKFTLEGEVELEITLNRKEKENLWLDFSISDTGIGILKSKLNAIFESFNQADTSTMREYGGTGLGLTLCKLYLELMGSHIEVESEPGKGSRFFFTLPVKAGSEDVQKSAAVANRQETKVNMEERKILLAEDTDVNRMVIRQFLEGWWGLKCHEAINGDEAIALAKKERFDLILMDVRMPVVDGYQATEAIRKLPGYRETPIVALTADTSQKVLDHVKSGFFNDLILKPVDHKDLRKKILLSITGEKEAVKDKPGKQTKGSPAEKENGFDEKKLDDFLKGREWSGEFLEKTLTEMNKVKEQFSKALQNRDRPTVEHLEHKTKWLSHLLGFENLQRLFNHSIELLKKEAPEEELKKTQEAGESMIRELIEILDKRIKK